MRYYRFKSFNTLVLVIAIALLSLIVTTNKDRIAQTIEKIMPVSTIPAPAAEPTTTAAVSVSVPVEEPNGRETDASERYTLKDTEVIVLDNENYRDLLRYSDFSSKAHYFRFPSEENICGLDECVLFKWAIKDSEIYSSTWFEYKGSGKTLSKASVDIEIYDDEVSPSDIDLIADEVSKIFLYTFNDKNYENIKDRNILKSLAMNFLSSYVPDHRSIPSSLIYRLPGYYVTFLMGHRTFSMSISFTQPEEHTIYMQ